MWITQLLALVTICIQYTCTSDLLQPCSDEGKWGEDCNKVCNHCLGGCDRGTGQCEQCQHGRYGLNCELTCSRECGITVTLRACDRTSGKCNSGCSDGKYGPYCNNTCDSKCLHGLCDFKTTECVECANGYTGKRCESKCKSLHCECEKCQKSDGKCLCCKPPATHVTGTPSTHVTGTPSTNPVCDQDGADTKTVIIVSSVLLVIFLLVHVPVYKKGGTQLWVDAYTNLWLGRHGLQHNGRPNDNGGSGNALQNNNDSEDEE